MIYLFNLWNRIALMVVLAPMVVLVWEVILVVGMCLGKRMVSMRSLVLRFARVPWNPQRWIETNTARQGTPFSDRGVKIA